LLFGSLKEDFLLSESHKIHKDHKIKESEDVKTPTNVTVKKPEMLIIKTDLDSKPKPDKRILTTNFAEIRRLKQGISNVDSLELLLHTLPSRDPDLFNSVRANVDFSALSKTTGIPAARAVSGVYT
jgi:hypothetical protein